MMSAFSDRSELAPEYDLWRGRSSAPASVGVRDAIVSCRREMAQAEI